MILRVFFLQGDNSTSELPGVIPGGIHRRCCSTQACRHLSLLAPIPQPQETDRGQVQPSESEHDHAKASKALQAARLNQN